MFNYITWDVSPILFSIGSYNLKWYSLLLTSGFIIGFFIIRRIFEKEGVLEKDFSIFIRYLFFSTIIGLRLGHCFFYDPIYYLKNPLEILMVWEGGLASHGAALGIVIGLMVYVRKYKKSFLWILDRVVIMVCLVGAMVRVGNLMNSEIIGSPTSSKTAFLFVNSIDKYLVKNNPNVISGYRLSKTNKDTVVQDITYAQMKLELEFKKGFSEQYIMQNMSNVFSKTLKQSKSMQTNIRLFNEPIVTVEGRRGANVALFNMWVIPRFPAQLFEALFYVLLFIILLLVYIRNKLHLYGGLLFSSFLLALFVYRFLIEFIKKEQVEFESNMLLNMGQLLSIPFIFAGITLLIYALKQRKVLSFSK